ncbi:hypothetical protein IHE45_11G092000 [Dioscorea alata]|uniref:Uncharacterized protein n=1 Tax=Dioscorea alata TaxID=55571 RepID=A0ACB7V8A3_DIOAL|nr:hypothetical protein IHE45_11G092000 [Dioscorea alata]
MFSKPFNIHLIIFFFFFFFFLLILISSFPPPEEQIELQTRPQRVFHHREVQGCLPKGRVPPSSPSRYSNDQPLSFVKCYPWTKNQGKP